MIEDVGPQRFLPGLFSGSLIVLILVNVVAAILETVPSVVGEHRALFNFIEHFSLAVFGIEYAIRLWTCVELPRYRVMPAWRARAAYIVTPAAIIDFIAIAPFFLGLFLDLNLRTLILLRLLRLFKLGRYSTGFQSLIEAVRRERQALLAGFLLLFSVVLIAASLAYVAERSAQPEAFGSIPAAVWWALETVTTVGYGDVTPKTLPGRIIGGLTMITGILMIALPVAIIGSSFAEVVRQRSFVVTFGLIARMPLFAGLPADVLSELLGVVKAMTVESGTPIIAAGSNDDGLYIVAAGNVELDDQGTRRRLGTGSVFGTGPVYDAPGSRLPALSLTRVKLLMIERNDLLDLVARYPELAVHLRPGFGAPDVSKNAPPKA
ncbi:MAG TPA: cyclic nucleotide-gated ion channel [Bauldia sp.]|nr:cyclic nucleotide-gated ion channel [Bauldia sp.]